MKATTDGVVEILGARYDRCLPTLRGGDHRVGRTEVDSYCLSHTNTPRGVLAVRTLVHRYRQRVVGEQGSPERMRSSHPMIRACEFTFRG